MAMVQSPLNDGRHSPFTQDWGSSYANKTAGYYLGMKPAVEPSPFLKVPSGFDYNTSQNMATEGNPFLNSKGLPSESYATSQPYMPMGDSGGLGKGKGDGVGSFGERTMDFWNSNYKGIGAGIGAVQGLVGAYAALKNLSLAKDNFNFQKETWNKQFDVQKRSINDQLSERQRYRYNNYRDQYESPEAYVEKYGVK